MKSRGTCPCVRKSEKSGMWTIYRCTTSARVATFSYCLRTLLHLHPHNYQNNPIQPLNVYWINGRCCVWLLFNKFPEFDLFNSNTNLNTQLEKKLPFNQFHELSLKNYYSTRYHSFECSLNLESNKLIVFNKLNQPILYL